MNRSAPPLLARLLFRLIPLGTRRAEAEADLEELFERRRHERGISAARRRYYRDVISLCRLRGHGSAVVSAPTGPQESLASGVSRDITHALRLFRRAPAVVIVATLGLGLAIGVSTAVFTILNAIIFRPTGVDHPSSVVRVMRAYENGMGTSWQYGEYLQLRESSANARLEAWLRENVSFATTPNAETPSTLTALFVSGGYLESMTGRTSAGRNLSPTDDQAGAEPVVVLSYSMWKRLLASDPSAVGRTIWLNGVAHTVVGVSAPGFMGPGDANPALWVPVATYHLATGGAPVDRRTLANFGIVARLDAKATRAQAVAELSAAARQLGPDGASPSETQLTGVRLIGADESVNEPGTWFVALVVAIVTTVVGLVLLLACINVANLLLASAVARRLEFGVRLAIGASRWRIVRQLLTESLLLATAGGLSGLVLSIWLVPVIARITGAPLLGDLTLDWSIYAVLAALTTVAGLATGLIPARYALREYDAPTVKAAKGTLGMTSGRPMASRAVFIGVQAAASVLLLVVAALLTRAMVRATHVEVGFDADRLLTVSPALARMYDQAGSKAYFEIAVERIRALPGVQSVTLAEASPFGNASRVTIFRRAGTSYTVYYNDTRAEYFSTLGLRVVQGRTYSAIEVADKAPVAVISEKLARDFFPGEDPLGQNLDRIVEDSRAVIIGVVSDAVTARLRELNSPTIFQPLGDTTRAKIVVRSQAAPDALVRPIRSALAPLDARVRLDIGLVSNGLQQQVAEPRALAALAAAIALLALALAIVGLYGVTTFVVGQRRREIGVRMALGATPRDVMQLLVSDSLRPVVFGLVAGVIAALIAGRVVSRTLFGVSSADPLAFGAAILILAVAATLAIVLPTRNAAEIDPALSLRQF